MNKLAGLVTVLMIVGISLYATTRMEQPSTRQTEAVLVSAEVAPPVPAATYAALRQLPMHFEEGNPAAGTSFTAKGPGYHLELLPDEAMLRLLPPVRTDTSVKPAVLRMRLVGGNPTPTISGREVLPGKSNYLIGNNPAQWRTNVSTYGKVFYEGVYPGIDVVYYGNLQQLEYDFIVAPGTNPDAITLDFDGAERMTLDESGNLILHVQGGQVVQHAPVSYQEANGVRQPVASRYVRKGPQQIGFEVGHYDPNLTLVIDPEIVYATYLSGNGADQPRGLAVDAAGNRYIVGNTTSTDFPTVSPIQDSFASGQDIFVAKLNFEGTALLYATYLGGDEFEFAKGIGLDAAGNAYIAGETRSEDFPVQNAVQPNRSAGSASLTMDVFVAALNADGSDLIYSTYLGGSNSEGTTGMGVDAAGNAYVTGRTASTDFRVANAFQDNIKGSADSFVAKFTTNGGLAYATYLGGSGTDEALGMKVDDAGNVYLVGQSSSMDFPLRQDIAPFTASGGNDGFVAKLNTNGQPEFTSFFGFFGRYVAMNKDGQIYVWGSNRSTQPTAPINAFQPTPGDASRLDGFLVKLNPTANAILYASYLGGSDLEQTNAIVVDADGNAYVYGITRSSDFPVKEAVQPDFGGDQDMFLAKVDATGGLEYATYLGGRRYDDNSPNSLAVDANGNVHFAFETDSGNLPTAPNAFQSFGRDIATYVGSIGEIQSGLQITHPSEIKAGQSAAVKVRILNPDGDVNTEFFSNVRFKLLGDLNQNGVREIDEKESTQDIGRLNTTISLVDEGVSENIFLFTPEEPFSSDRPINDQTVISGTAFIAVEVEEPVLRDTIRIEVRSPLDIFIKTIDIQQGVADLPKDVSQEFKPGEDKVFPALPFISEHQTGVRVPIEFSTIEPFSEVRLTGIEGDLRISGPSVEETLHFKTNLMKEFLMKDEDGYTKNDTVQMLNGLFTIVEPQVLKNPGSYTFEVELDLEPRLSEIAEEKTNNIRDTTHSFVNTNAFKVLAVIGLFENSTIPPLNETVLGPFGLVKKIYPVERSKFIHTDPRSIQPWMLKNTFSRLQTYGQLHYRLWLYNKKNNTQYEKLLLITDHIGLNNLCPGTGGCVPNPAWGKFGIVFGDDPAGTAHELGHTLGLGDTYSTRIGSPKQSGNNPRRSDAIDNGNLIDRGTVVLFPETGDTKLVTMDDRSVDFMGNGSWIDRATWDYLYRTKFGIGGSNKSMNTTASGFVVVSGVISDDGSVLLNPFIKLPQIPDVSTSSTGPYTLEFLNQNGIALTSFPFDLDFIVPDFGPVSYMPFSIELPFPDDAREIAILKNGSPLISRTLSENPPIVQIHAPIEGAEIDGVTTISWTASDPDGDDLTYSLLYSADGSEQIIVDALLAETSYAWNSRVYPASPSGSITVIANDGINTGDDVIENIIINADPSGAAPAFASVSPANAVQGATGVQIMLQGQNFQNGASVTFSSAGVISTNVMRRSDSELQIVVDVAANADPGPRDLTVTNPDGLSTTAVGAFEVLAQGSLTALLRWDPPAPGETLFPPDNLRVDLGSGTAAGKHGIPHRSTYWLHRPARSHTAAKHQPRMQTAAQRIDEIEPNNHPDDAQGLTGPAPVTVNGNAEVDDEGLVTINFGDDLNDDLEDLFRVTITEPGLVITLDGFASDLDLYLIDEEITTVLDASDIIGATDAEFIEDIELPVGTYIIGISIFDADPIGGPTTPYTLTVLGTFEGDTGEPPTLLSYNIYRSLTSDPFSSGNRIASVDATTTTYLDALPSDGIYHYQVTAVYDQGESDPSEETVLSVAVAVEDQTAVSAAFVLAQNYPNPFNPTTTIPFEVNEPGRATLKVFNVLGQHIQTVVDGNYAPGRYQVSFDARGLPSGLYMYQLEAGSHRARKRMLLLK